MVRTSAVRKKQIFFREKYGIMYEESDYAYRIRQAGYKIMVVRDAKIYHDIENELEGIKVKIICIILWKIKEGHMFLPGIG